MQNVDFRLGFDLIVCALLAIVALVVLPWRFMRMRYWILMTYGAICLTGLAWMTIRNWEGSEYAEVRWYGSATAPNKAGPIRKLGFRVQRGGVEFIYRSSITNEPARNAPRLQLFSGVRFAWQHIQQLPPIIRHYPRFDPPSFPATLWHKGWGFEVMVFGQAEKPVGTTLLNSTGVIVPVWCVMIVLLLPIRWCLKKQRQMAKRACRLANNLCIHCGYSLQGLPEPVRCPECGTHAKAQAKPAVPPAAAA